MKRTALIAAVLGSLLTAVPALAQQSTQQPGAEPRAEAEQSQERQQVREEDRQQTPRGALEQHRVRSLQGQAEEQSWQARKQARDQGGGAQGNGSRDQPDRGRKH